MTVTHALAETRTHHIQACIDRVDLAVSLIRRSHHDRDLSLQDSALRMAAGTLIESLDEKPVMSLALVNQADTLMALTAQTLQGHEQSEAIAEVLSQLHRGRADLAKAVTH